MTPLCLAIGIFDGVHLGHQAVIDLVLAEAKTINGKSAVLTFSPHPREFFRPSEAVSHIMSPQVKEYTLKSLGVDSIIEQPFDADFAALSPQAFAVFLKKTFPTLHYVAVGASFRFGVGRSGDLETLKKLGQSLKVEVVGVPLRCEGQNPISSTLIRKALIEGDMSQAARLMGHPYLSQARRIAGEKRGKKLGFPTINLPVTQKNELQPRFGVYTGWMQLEQRPERLSCVMNYGVRPTLNAPTAQPLLEVHCLESIDVPVDTLVTVAWSRFLRPEQKFSSLEALKAQIAQDVLGAKGSKLPLGSHFR